MAEKTLRADARKNRDRLIEAGSAVFAEQGLGGSLEEVARRAGVSIGTLYNHFPHREDLIDAIFPMRVRTLADVAEDALAIEDPWDGFVRYVEGFFELQAEDRGLNEALLRWADNASELQAACNEGFAKVGAIIRRAQRAGALRKDFKQSDLVLFAWANARIVDATRAIRPDAWRRHLGFLLDGLRADAAHRIGVSAMTSEELARATEVTRAQATGARVARTG